MKIARNKKISILLAVFGILLIFRLVMFLFETPADPTRSRRTANPLPKQKSWREAPVERVEEGLLHVTFPFSGGLFGRKTVVGYLVPLDEHGKPRPGSDRMIFYAPAAGDAKIPGSQPWLRQLAEESGCTVFTMLIVGKASEAEDRKSYFIYPESGWHEMVFKAQKAVAKRQGFSVGKLLLFGISAGGSMVQQLCAANPEKIAAAAWQGGSRYLDKIDKNDNVPRLILSTWGCPGEQNSIRYAEQARRHGVPALDLRTPPDFQLKKSDHHGPGPEAYSLMYSYLSSTAALGEANGGKIPPTETWLEGKFPSSKFASLWKSIRSATTEDAKSLVVIFASSESPLLQDMKWLLRQAKADVMVVHPENNFPQERKRCIGLLEKLLSEKAESDLPIYIFGVGANSQAGAVATLNLNSPRIRRLVLWNTPLDSVFPELSILEQIGNSSIPVVYYGNNPAPDIPGMEFRSLGKESNLEYAEKIRESIQP